MNTLGALREDDTMEESDFLSMGALDIETEEMSEMSDISRHNSNDPTRLRGAPRKFSSPSMKPSESTNDTTISNIMRKGSRAIPSSGRTHKRAATMQLSWRSKHELQSQTKKDFTFFNEAIMSIKKSLDVHQKDNVKKELVIGELTEKVGVLEDVITDLQDHITSTESQIGERDEVIAELNLQIEERERQILHLQAETSAERIVKEEIDRRRTDDQKARIEEAHRYAVMLCAMQEQLEFERLHFIQKLKEKDRSILSLKNEIFKHKLSLF
eukprot:TRINITY_DN3474_c0_g2_i1.p1 TRINITY_DN3474_c0_g2~~TRINITY_DN3474_c0_g2_i1.p1  ORF type:complete len:270 (-),score=43.25 TRINITY_DN3474_c0_g2_i1:77-886(-)